MDSTGHTHFLPMVRASELAKVKPTPLEFVDGFQLFLKNDLNYLSGIGAAGKTTICLQLAAAVALSTHTYPGPALWLDRPVNVRGPVMFVSGEETANTLHLALLDVCADQGIGMEDLGNLVLHDISARDDKALLSSAGRGKPVVKTALFHTFKATVASLKPVLIILDNRAQIAHVDEIDRGHATGVGNIFRAVSAEHQTTTILLTHPSVSGEKDGRSGSTGWNNTARNTALMCKPPDAKEDAVDDGRRQLTVPKANRSKMGLRANLQWAAGVYRCTDQPPKADAGIGSAHRAERVFLSLLKWHNENGISVSLNTKAQNYAPKVFFVHPDHERCSLKELATAMYALEKAKRIRTVSYGPPSDKTYRLEVV